MKETIFTESICKFVPYIGKFIEANVSKLNNEQFFFII